MAATYNSIAQQYKSTLELPFRQYAEEYTYFDVLGDLSGKSILDLACGEGHYTRKFKHKGAAHVVGVDISEKMIELARQEEKRKPLGIEYIVCDARELGEIDKFDMVVAAYLINYAQTREQLIEMCRIIYTNLKPGGRFVTINENFELPPDAYSKANKYGFTRNFSEPLYDGAPMTIILTAAEGQEVSFEVYCLSNAVYDSAFQNVGFKEIRRHPIKISPDGMRELGHEYWEYFLQYPNFVCINCLK
uniref:Methyltransferase domain-containing protein n=1 Tax=Candidatus Kentrum sp. FM TaxID=2126340 RepID=A0A450S4Q8_9GAMM|nr:MAG: Methyltransferase domain-containing protein [Candidatus Kentron sp. FM]VFJ47769.1 MAG: Methyltransferase domain-containing protein [Candidatus Kentron sp. FM]VFK07952.1 MAG: Methyltransferase domain-containing protein [Candidatus Kentron sp. FM]